METEFGKILRAESGEYRGHVKAMIDRLGGRGTLAAELLAVAETPDMPPDAKARIEAIAKSLEDSSGSVPLITAITGAVSANVYDVLADLTDYLTAKGSLKTVVDKIRGHREFNSALRDAAASGNWDRFDELTKHWNSDGETAPTGTDGIAESGPDPQTGGGGDADADGGGGVG